MAELWRVELLGGLRAVHPDRVVTRFRTQKAGALLAYLALYPHRGHSRGHLIEILWPEEELDSARDRLRVALSSLRRQLEPPGVPRGAVIAADRLSVRLNPGAVTTDVAQFEAALRSADRGAGRTEQVEWLTAAVELYRGPLLPSSFETWVLPEQQRLSGLYFQAISQLVHELETMGQLRRALDYAARAVAADPLCEEGQRELIRLLARVGQPSAALEQSRRLETHLQKELGELPSEATRLLVARIEQQAASLEQAGATAPSDVEETSEARSRTASVAPQIPPAGTVTLLLSEIERSSIGEEERGEGQSVVPESQKALLREALQRHGGYLVKETSGAWVVTFARASEAARAALDARSAWVDGSHLDAAGSFTVRMGLHTGEVDPIDGVSHGPVIREATRLLAVARPGEIVCSEVTAALLRRGLLAGREPAARLLDLGADRLGDSEPHERLFRIDGSGMPSQPLSSPNSEAGSVRPLPLHATRFFGREQELAELRELLQGRKTRLVTLTGPGGSGKTRLAIEVAEALRETMQGAVWWVPLVGLADPRLIVDAVRDAMRLPRSPGATAFEQVVAALNERDAPALLVLDNFEHLVEGGAEWVRDLLERVPALQCLVTSRQLLALGGEREFAVNPLPAPAGPASPEELIRYDSAKLFIDRAQAVRPAFQVTARNAAAIAELCRRLEGIPLAIELAAAHVRLLAPEQILRMQARRFDFLTSRRRDLPPRHRTLRAAIEGSYQLLAPDLQRFFARLSIFRGGWSLEAAAATLESDLPSALDALAELRARSLLQVEGGGSEARYQMLETLREYAAEQLTPEERDRIAERHARHYMALVEEAEPHLGLTPRRDAWLARLERDHDNLRAAISWCLDSSNAEVGLRLAGALRHFWWWLGYLAEGRECLEGLLALPGAAVLTAARAKALLAAGQLAATQGDGKAAEALARQSLALHRELGDRWRVGVSLSGLAGLASGRGDYPASRALYEENLAISRELGNMGEIAGTLGNLSNVASAQGDFAAAWQFHEESAAIHRSIGNPEPVWGAAQILIRQGDLATARDVLESGVTFDPHGIPRGSFAGAHYLMVLVLLGQGDAPAARALLERYLTGCQQSGNKSTLIQCVEAFAALALLEGDADRAARLFGAADALRETRSHPRPPADRATHEQRVATARALLGGPAFRAAWSQGRLLSLEQAIALASGAEPRR
jgi:non-specific serine/threonine protein kinase